MALQERNQDYALLRAERTELQRAVALLQKAVSDLKELQRRLLDEQVKKPHTALVPDRL